MNSRVLPGVSALRHAVPVFGSQLVARIVHVRCDRLPDGLLHAPRITVLRERPPRPDHRVHVVIAGAVQ
jgi:hypothetical protein